MTSNDHSEGHAREFDSVEEQWFARSTRPSRRPTLPAPASTEELARLDDSIADGWFFDV